MAISSLGKVLTTLLYMSTTTLGNPIAFQENSNKTRLSERAKPDAAAYCVFYDGDGNPNPTIGIKGWGTSDFTDDDVTKFRFQVYFACLEAGESDQDSTQKNARIGDDRTVYDYVLHLHARSASHTGCIKEQMDTAGAPRFDLRNQCGDGPPIPSDAPPVLPPHGVGQTGKCPNGPGEDTQGPNGHFRCK